MTAINWDFVSHMRIYWIRIVVAVATQFVFNGTEITCLWFDWIYGLVLNCGKWDSLSTGFFERESVFFLRTSLLMPLQRWIPRPDLSAWVLDMKLTTSRNVCFSQFYTWFLNRRVQSKWDVLPWNQYVRLPSMFCTMWWYGDCGCLLGLSNSCLCLL